MVLLALALAGPTPPLPAEPAPRCQQLERLTTAKRGAARIEPLNRQPDADAYLTVWRSVDGCPMPVKVRDERRR